MDPDFWIFFAVGVAAQLVDGALGMAYGVVSSTVLLAPGARVKVNGVELKAAFVLAVDLTSAVAVPVFRTASVTVDVRPTTTERKFTRPLASMPLRVNCNAGVPPPLPVGATPEPDRFNVAPPPLA